MSLRENKVPELIQEADRSKWTVHNNRDVKCFTKDEIEIFTNNFSTMIGRGGFGEVFQGNLENKSIAVKRFIHTNVKENFAKELTVHSGINHRNVVRLIGYCVDKNALMMVTEYIPNGNLSYVLHQESNPIPLDIRLRIATECAEALAYMHSHMYAQVIHGDIKPDNILLDDSYNAKISDFGISRLVNTDNTLYTENIKGSIGYMDPMFAQDGLLTVKSDVYSFGVVLLELITRKKATTKVEHGSFIDQCTGAISRGNRGMREMFDVEIIDQNNMKTLEGIAKLARECLMMERDTRPEMTDVVVRLRMLAKPLRQAPRRVGFSFWPWKSKQSAPASVTIPSTKAVPLTMASSSTNDEPLAIASRCRQFSFEEMEAATKKFDKSLLLGVGDFGKVYCGTIDGGATKVAVKCLRYANGDDDRQRFLTNIDKSLKLCHRHLVPLIGYCSKEDEFMVVYEYMSLGSLREHLYGIHNNPPLPWTRRLEICIGAARGLHHLHRGTELAMIHCTVKLENILLDEEWVAKVSHNIESDPRNSTNRYWYGEAGDPEREDGLGLTVKSDVYSFGAVLFEVLCARPIVDRRRRPQEQIHLVRWAACCKDEGNLNQIVDPHLKREINRQSLHKFVETAEKCLTYWGDERPSMEDVISDLECALQLQKRRR